VKAKLFLCFLPEPCMFCSDDVLIIKGIFWPQYKCKLIQQNFFAIFIDYQKIIVKLFFFGNFLWIHCLVHYNFIKALTYTLLLTF